ncbi:prenyltransferase/squalene oxidase repeat-containing protein [Cellulosilyticum ruminicola]|uniref:prenyltransferase/squalene oxidase repeat-containing protein n=1 Tax=Cellulosilyticum ruminicola TaxID=425254 RepID=UPI0006D02262|nr:prenyltransferase/squalene oxidase repeat-containing protein [Cellulosilyticum ruminicola]
MQRILKHIGYVILSFCIICSSAFAMTQSQLESKIGETAAYMCKVVKEPTVGSIGGEWAVLGLARSGYKVPKDYYQNYYKQVESYVKACKGNLHARKYTEYSRVIVALTALGKNPKNVGGYNLLTALGDYEKTIWQGLNGPIWALIALDSGDYEMPQNKQAKVQATRQMYVDKILKSQLSDGGFSLTGEGSAEVDITAMALTALAKYQDQKEVKLATQKALNCLSKLQNNEGGYTSYGVKNSESVVQVIVALTELNISLIDKRFVKNGKTLVDNLMTFYMPKGGFKHGVSDKQVNQMATEQGFYGLVAISRFNQKQNSLYRMKEANQKVAMLLSKLSV